MGEECRGKGPQVLYGVLLTTDALWLTQHTTVLKTESHANKQKQLQDGLEGELINNVLWVFGA